MASRRRLPIDSSHRPRTGLDRVLEPVTPSDASTVLLLRESGMGPEVYLMRRHATMAFASGSYVFPGGGVDPSDFDPQVGWAGPPPQDWARLLGCDSDLARAVVCAAVRETFEESGVLLAGPSAHEVVAGTIDPSWEAERVAVEARELAFTDFLSGRNLVLRSDLLRFWSRWITPEAAPRRFDTRFFVAELPRDQETRDVSSESDDVMWTQVDEVVHRVDEGGFEMLLPTSTNLRDVAAHPTVDAVMRAGLSRTPKTVRPRVAIEGDKTFLLLDDGS